MDIIEEMTCPLDGVFPKDFKIISINAQTNGEKWFMVP